MRELLVVVDMQTDFVDGALGTKEAQNIVENVVSKVKSAKECGRYYFYHGYASGKLFGNSGRKEASDCSLYQGK